MSSGPEVCVICPTRNRPQFLERAVGCFLAQDYPNRRMVVWNSGDQSIGLLTQGVKEIHVPQMKSYTVGALRNECLKVCDAPIICHFDDDDWSAPDRISQQVGIMELSGASVVGYYDEPLYDLQRNEVLWYDSQMRNYSVGTGLMYRREVWERCPFPDKTPEDTIWQHLIGTDNICSISSLRHGIPIIIQTLHGSNGAATRNISRFEKASSQLERVVRYLLESA